MTVKEYIATLKKGDDKYVLVVFPKTKSLFPICISPYELNEIDPMVKDIIMDKVVEEIIEENDDGIKEVWIR